MLRRLPRPIIFYRYIAREIFSDFWVTLFVFTGILFLMRVLNLVDLVVTKNVPITDILLLFSYVIPRFLELAVPMALLIGVILVFGRLSADSELIVMRTSGLSFRQLAVPVAVFSLIAFVLTLILSCWVTPWANHRLGLGVFEIAKMQASTGLVPGVFNEVGLLTIYAEKIDKDTGRLQHVIIADRRNPEISRNFIAKNGQIVSDDKTRTLMLRLYDGSISEGSGLDYNITYFEINNITLPHAELMTDKPARDGKKSDELYIHELIPRVRSLRQHANSADENLVQQRTSLEVELHRRFGIPASCLFVALIAMALGVQPSRGGKTWGGAVNFVVGIGVILLYYLLFSAANAFCAKGFEPVWLFMWIPNLLLCVIAVVSYSWMGSERWMQTSGTIGELLSRVFRALDLST